ncbi:MAG TPA: sulfurtransferase TusA family protein [Ramlibacter sp.]
MNRLSSGEDEFVSDPGVAAQAPPAGEMQELDARGIGSPLHILRAYRALRAMKAGQLLKVLTSSGQTLAEFQALSKYLVGYELLSQEQVGDEFVHVLRKKR